MSKDPRRYPVGIRRFPSLLVLTALTALFIGCFAPDPTPTPTATVAPTATPTPFTSDQARDAARRWSADNEGPVRADIGRAIAALSGTVASIDADLDAQITEVGQQWEDGQVQSEIVWTGVHLALPPGPDGRWEVTLTSESVTDVQHRGAEGQLKAEVPFRVFGTGDQVNGYEVLLDQAVVGVEGVTIEVDLDQTVLDKDKVDAAIEGILGKP